MKRIFFTMGLGMLAPAALLAFCGIYVSKSDGTLKNKASQVILVRDGNRNRITMYNDFKGDVKDFALVVPVPVLLKQADIKVVDPSIFRLLNDYSAPRLVEYYDENPCSPRYYEDKMSAIESPSPAVLEKESTKKDYGVKIEARYLVGEYDILILGATESNGLKRWLTDNGYKIPGAAEEVLDPYIKSNMKFFVAKVNPQRMAKLADGFLRPIQISFNSPKFMLPIRLGMANSTGDQDLIVYGISRSGRLECTNYRTVEMPTGNHIPLFIKDDFNAFYQQAFTKKWNQEGRNIALVEYAWDVSPVNYLKCDPCVGNPPQVTDLVQAGVWWLQETNWNDYSNIDDPGYDGSTNTFFTRLHVRYNRGSFPQDLAFQFTPNTTNYQSRYVITHPASGSFACDAGKAYLVDLKQRRKEELRELYRLTDKTQFTWKGQNDNAFIDEAPGELDYARIAAEGLNLPKEENGFGLIGWASLVVLGGAGWMRWRGVI